jgi:hypothetical protein
MWPSLTERIQGRGIPLSGSSGFLIPRPGMTITIGTRTIEININKENNREFRGSPGGAEFYESHLYCN